jgi:hypothetical protein
MMTLADLESKLDLALKNLFQGQLPDSLKRVGEDYIYLARHLLERGKPIDGVAECLDMAIQNSLEMEQKLSFWNPKKTKRQADWRDNK